MNQYLLILRDHESKWDNFSPDELQRVVHGFAEWNRNLAEAERLVSAGKLDRDLGVTVRKRGGEVVVDGPFSEAKEAIAGYFCIRAEDLESAGEVAQSCPILTYGGSVEVRLMADAGACDD